MSRLARSIVVGYPYHISHRGNNKQRIFDSDDDRRLYLYWFEEARLKWGMKVLAYCLMDNHVHYVAVAGDKDSFAKTIGAVHTRYAIYHNEKNGCVGHLWHGRYYSDLLDDRHLMAAVRYTEQNPVRAGMVCKPWDWVWSSARGHLQMEKSIINLEDTSPFFKMASWQEYIDQESKEGLKLARPARRGGRPKKA